MSTVTTTKNDNAGISFSHWFPSGFEGQIRESNIRFCNSISSVKQPIRQFASAFPTAAFAGQKGSNVGFFRLNSMVSSFGFIYLLITSPLRKFHLPCQHLPNFFSPHRTDRSAPSSKQLSASHRSSPSTLGKHFDCILSNCAINLLPCGVEMLKTGGGVVLDDVCLSHILMCSRGQPMIILRRLWQRISYRKSSQTSQRISTVAGSMIKSSVFSTKWDSCYHRLVAFFAFLTVLIPDHAPSL